MIFMACLELFTVTGKKDVVMSQVLVPLFTDHFPFVWSIIQ